MAPLRFYFDFISPYAYLGWKAVHRLADAHERSVEPIPILFAALLNHHGHKGPAEIAPKRVYIFKHVLRLAAAAEVPLSPPPAHPFRPLLGLRVAGLPELEPSTRRRVIEALFDATWGDGPGIESPETVAEVLSARGLDGATLVQRATEPEVKRQLIDATQGAIAAGVFGVPTLDVDGELFWGYDAFDHVDAYLAGRDPLPHDVLERWQDLPASASRT